MNVLPIGSLVISEQFEGIGKVVTVDSDTNNATVAFFESPAQPYARQMKVPLEQLTLTIPHEETVIYCIEPHSQRWTRARFGGSRPKISLPSKLMTHRSFSLTAKPLLKPTSSNALHAARWHPFLVVPLNSNPTNWR